VGGPKILILLYLIFSIEVILNTRGVSSFRLLKLKLESNKHYDFFYELVFAKCMSRPDVLQMGCQVNKGTTTIKISN
jgi:hypothetical protein